MIRVLLFSFVFNIVTAYGQNEFAASSFYTTFKKIQEDGEKGFAQFKGPQLKSQFSEIKVEYKIKLLLPLADSGKIVVPAAGNPYAVYFFEPEKRKENIDERAVHLREAILTAHANPLYAKTVSTTLDRWIHSDTYFYAETNQNHTSLALYRISVFYQDGKYHLLLEIKGKHP